MQRQHPGTQPACSTGRYVTLRVRLATGGGAVVLVLLLSYQKVDKVCCTLHHEAVQDVNVLGEAVENAASGRAPEEAHGSSQHLVYRRVRVVGSEQERQWLFDTLRNIELWRLEEARSRESVKATVRKIMKRVKAPTKPR